MKKKKLYPLFVISITIILHDFYIINVKKGGKKQLISYRDRTFYKKKSSSIYPCVCIFEDLFSKKKKIELVQ